jgi:hypothetical protein
MGQFKRCKHDVVQESGLCCWAGPYQNNELIYRISFSLEDQEWVGTCEQFPSLSWLSRDPIMALEGIRKVSEEMVWDLAREEAEGK